MTALEKLNELRSGIDSVEELIKTQVIVQPVEKIPTVASVMDDYNKLQTKDRQMAHFKMCDIGEFGVSIDDRLILLTLIGTMVIASRKKNPGVSVEQVVEQLVEHPDWAKSLPDEFTKFKENLCNLVRLFITGVSQGNTFGMKDVPSIKGQINEIISKRLPF